MSVNKIQYIIFFILGDKNLKLCIKKSHLNPADEIFLIAIYNSNKTTTNVCIPSISITQQQIVE